MQGLNFLYMNLQLIYSVYSTKVVNSHITSCILFSSKRKKINKKILNVKFKISIMK